MSTMMVESPAISAAPAVTAPLDATTTLQLVKAIPVAPELEEITFLHDHPLVPVFVIGAISMVLAVAAVGSIVFWLAIRYSGVLAP